MNLKMKNFTTGADIKKEGKYEVLVSVIFLPLSNFKISQSSAIQQKYVSRTWEFQIL